MIKVSNLLENPLVEVSHQKGCFRVLEYQRDLSVSPEDATTAYFSAQMKVRKRQLYCDLSQTNGIVMQAGAMQWMLGDVQVATDIKGAGDLLGKVFKGKVTGESAVKPKYTGSGLVVTEPSYRHLLLLDVAEWGGELILDDGLFLACESSLEQKLAPRTNLSSAVLGGQGLFNLKLVGQGACCLESSCPMEELVTIELENDTLRIDGNFAIAWSAGLKFTVERTTSSLIGSAASAEGLVNVYRGTGKILMMPLE